MRTKKTNIEDPQKVKVVNSNPHSTISNRERKPSFVLDTPNHQSQPAHTPDICHSPDDTPQDVDKSHLSDSTSTTANLNETCSLDTSCDHLLHLDSPSIPPELQDTSSARSVEIEFVPDFEKPLEGKKFSPTDVFSVQHDFDLFLCNQEIDSQSDNLNHQDTHVCKNQGQDDFLFHATKLSHNLTLPQFMAQHHFEVLRPIDTPSIFSILTHASSDHTSNPICAHNLATSAINPSTPPCSNKFGLITHLQVRKVKPTFQTF